MNDNYKTPGWIMELFFPTFSGGWFDPCPYDPNWKKDGLKIPWEDYTFINPPYSRPLPWVKKAINEKLNGNYIVMLLKADSSTEVWRLCNEHGQILYFGRRIKFNGKPANFPNMLVIFDGVTNEK